MPFLHLYFSPRGETQTIALYFHRQLGGELVDLTLPKARASFDVDTIYDIVIVSLPVYAAQVPKPMRGLLSKLTCQHLVINAVYGGMTIGNIVYDVFKRVRLETLEGYTMTPVKHSYLDRVVAIDTALYDPLINKLTRRCLSPVAVPRFQRINLGCVLETWRTRYNYRVKILKTRCTDCGICISQCPVGAITASRIATKTCIRCSRCVHLCTENAIIAKQSTLLRLYLKKNPDKRVLIDY